jgi:hypothetical protein
MRQIIVTQKFIAIFATLSALGFGLSGCQPANSQVEFVESMKHPNGLIGKRPAGMNAKLQPYGFDMIEAAAVRSPLSFSLMLFPPGSPPPKIAPYYFGLFGPRYVVSNSGGGGSGGEEYKLAAARQIGTCWLMVVAFKQSEGTPSFLEAWAALDNSSVTAAAGC